MRCLTVFGFFCLALINHTPAAADAAAGEKLYAAKGCMACHGPGGKSANPAAFPSTAGLDAAYIEEQMKAFRSGTRNNPLMTPMATGLTDQEITDLAAYLAAQPK